MPCERSVIGAGVLGTGNENRDGTGAMVALAAGSTYGTVVTQIDMIAVEATSIGVIRLFIDYEPGGSDGPLLYDEVQVDEVAPDGTPTDGPTNSWRYVWTAPAPSAVATFSGAIQNLLELPNGAILYASTHNEEPFNIFVRGYDK
jgi:hypothetical protein